VQFKFGRKKTIRKKRTSEEAAGQKVFGQKTKGPKTTSRTAGGQSGPSLGNELQAGYQETTILYFLQSGDFPSW
jgi:hypothetical protein